MRMRMGWALGILAVALPARAQSGDRHHDGFYAQLAVGPSMIRDSYESGGGNLFWDETRGTVTGFGHSQHIAIGGAVAPGFNLAGAAVVDIARTTSVEYEGEPTHPKDDYVIATFGPLLDYYVDPNAGFHLLAGVGLGITSGVEPEGADGGSSSGLGLFAGVGNEWWIAPEWGLGALLRFQYVRGTESIVTLIDDTFEIHHDAIGIALMFSATYN